MRRAVPQISARSPRPSGRRIMVGRASVAYDMSGRFLADGKQARPGQASGPPTLGSYDSGSIAVGAGRFRKLGVRVNSSAVAPLAHAAPFLRDLAARLASVALSLLVAGLA